MIIKSMQSNQVSLMFAQFDCDKWNMRRSFFFSLIRTIGLLRIIPSDFGVSYQYIFGTLDFGLLYIRALTQTIKRNHKIDAGIQSPMEFIIEKKYSNHCECYFNQSSYRQQYNFGAGHWILNLTYFQLETLILSKKWGLHLWIRWWIFFTVLIQKNYLPPENQRFYKMHNKKSFCIFKK